MKHRISPATVIASVALFFSLAGAGMAATPKHRMRTFSFMASRRVHELALPGQGANISIARVNIDGQEAAYGEVLSGGANIYGDGVVVGITQHGERYTVSAVALQPASVTIRYSIS